MTCAYIACIPCASLNILTRRESVNLEYDRFMAIKTTCNCLRDPVAILLPWKYVHKYRTTAFTRIAILAFTYDHHYDLLSCFCLILLYRNVKERVCFQTGRHTTAFINDGCRLSLLVQVCSNLT